MRVRLHKYWRSEVSKRLAWARRSAGITQLCLATKMGAGLQTVCKIEQGKHVPDLHTMLIWCLACGVSPYIIVEGLTTEGVVP